MRGGAIHFEAVVAHLWLLETDSTIAPPKKISDFSFTGVSWLLDTRKGAIKKNVSVHFFLVQNTIER